ncbi:thymidylate synthase [Vibrio phage phi-ST2]|uniref:thymidylate synthase n=2 Tax=Schizotequatrovirus TaxID=1198137 RepID=A0A140B3G8_9CAUD|nr:thymidylate synthase [Vibrio phage VH7D]ALP47026.1 thymidylate synthase [Vibrio phage phi-Grn1]ALP47405.1 thymidylate synthase [Vibrio phage phi-ST2]QBX06058.1 thymidylate synthase [Vibrio phage Va3]QNJ54684.1 thymidylate synthase [Vibrio phage vB_ValM_R10Z]QNJ55070.1 thymidylate synthase [Vibrio phage vB_ValM_R11Z]URQ03615.1 thymidylate synthase [Vibrio phage PVA23]
MKNYLELCKDILENGDFLENRTGTNTVSVVSRELRWDLEKGFPLLTTKKMATRAIFGELLWFLSGSGSISELRKYTELSDEDFCIWQQNLDELNERAKEAGIVRNEDDLGYVYGKVWRKRLSVNAEREIVEFDQIHQLLCDIAAVNEDPTQSAQRRMLVEAWDPYFHTESNSVDVALPPCHYGFQVFVRNGKISLKWNQRSVDTFLGLPFNIASYALLVHILAKLTGLGVGELIFSGGDVHIYEDHLIQVMKQMRRTPRALPQIELPEFETLSQLLTKRASDFRVYDYDPYPTLKGKMS